MFKDYNDYVHAQVVEGFSHEFEIKHWSSGQIKSIDDFLIPFLQTTDTVLDAACGDGVGVRHLVDKGYKNVIGVDINLNKIEHAKKYVPEATFLMSDITNIDLPNEYFDAVWTSHTLEHSYDPIKTLKEFKRLLKPTGAIYIIVPYPSTSHRIHCGSSILKLDIEDEAKSTLNFLKSEGYNILNSKIINIREPELFINLK